MIYANTTGKSAAKKTTYSALNERGERHLLCGCEEHIFVICGRRASAVNPRESSVLSYSVAMGRVFSYSDLLSEECRIQTCDCKGISYKKV